MANEIKSVHFTRLKKPSDLVKRFGVENAKVVNDLHKSFPNYEATPLIELKALSNYLSINTLYIKDESYRFGLNAFKGLGGSYSISKYIADRLDINLKDLSFERLKSPEVKEQLGDITFVTATDGNHGRGVAWTASELGYKSVVFMPKGSSLERLENIKSFGGEAYIMDMNYDDAVRYANDYAEKNDGIIIQDTSWEGYEDIPEWIMEGYTTMGHEITEQMADSELTHIFLQAGVGAMAGAMTGYFSDFYSGKTQPRVVIVESDQADCIYKTAKENDGELHTVQGDLDTIMAGLACGEPCSIGWDILNEYANSFISIPDYVAAKGMRVLANPLGDDKRIISGESGAATAGFVVEVLENKNLKDLKEELELSEQSKILCISTEGDTDQENYRKVLWDGLYPTP